MKQIGKHIIPETEEEKQALINKRAEDWYNHVKEHFSNITQFESVDDIPEVPKMRSKEDYELYIISNLIRCGAIPKCHLTVHGIYEGSCRNSSEAIWTGTEFKYNRYKHGSYFVDSINHFEDDDGYDLFVPIKLIRILQKNENYLKE